MTFHRSHNNGSMLQALALQNIISEKYNCCAEIIDFSNYANYNYGNSDNGGFLSSFANAVAVIGTDCGGFAGASAGTSCASSCSSGGGFTSFV